MNADLVCVINSIHCVYVNNIPRHILKVLWLGLRTTLGASRQVIADLVCVMSSLHDKHADLVRFMNSLHDEYNTICVIIPAAMLVLPRLV